jgi:hypothetical protein
VAPASQNTSRESKNLLSAGQVEIQFHNPIFLNFYDASCALRCRASAAAALVGIFNSSVEKELADLLVNTPLCESLIRSAAGTFAPIVLNDHFNKLPFECTRKLVQYLSLCCMAMMSIHHSIAFEFSKSSEFKDLILKLLREGQPEFKPYVIILIFFISRTTPRFIQSLFEDVSIGGHEAVGSIIRSILDFTAEYCLRYYFVRWCFMIFIIILASAFNRPTNMKHTHQHTQTHFSAKQK